MSENTKRHIHLIYDIVLSAVLGIDCICLMIACVGIYLSGEKPFTPDSVAFAFQSIAVPIYLCLALVVARFVLEGFIPRPRKKNAPQKQYDAILARLYETKDITQCPADIQSQIRRIRASRIANKWIGLGLLTTCSQVFLLYGANPHNFHQTDINGSMARAVCLLMGCMAIPFGFCVFAAYARTVGLKREIALLKGSAPSVNAPGNPVKKSGSSGLVLRYVVLGIAVTLLIYGFMTGGTKDVLTKAVNICTECVGLG